MSSYDQNLLDDAPKATRAQLQEGYNVDLLEQPPRRTPSVRGPPPPQSPQPLSVTVPLTPGIPEAGSGEKLGSVAYDPSAPKPRTSFWRTRNGIITIIVIALVVVGAVVGGAVGGTVKKSSSSNVDRTGTNNATTSSSAPSSSVPPESAGIIGGTGSRAAAGSTPTPTSTQKGQNSGGQAYEHYF